MGRLRHVPRSVKGGLRQGPTSLPGWTAGRLVNALLEQKGPAQQAALGLAGLTPGIADDIAAATSALDFWKSYLPVATMSGDPNAINTVVGQINEWQGTLDQLTESTDRQNDLLQQQIAAEEAHTDAVNEHNRLLRDVKALALAQGPSLTAALIQAANGSLGGNAGLGRQFPSSVGLGGLSRA